MPKGIYQKKITPPEIRFWAKVDVTNPESCWYWKAAADKDNYGVFQISNKKSIGAHRMAYLLSYGPIPKFSVTRHKCDTPLCVNPNHLELGTQKDNINDKVVRNRQAKGSTNGQSRLNESLVLTIRKLYNTGEYTFLDLANKFNVHYSNIGYIINRKTWRHI